MNPSLPVDDPSASVVGIDPNYQYLLVLQSELTSSRVCKVGRKVKLFGVGWVTIQRYHSFDSCCHIFELEPVAFQVLDDSLQFICSVTTRFLVARLAATDLPWYRRLHYHLCHRFRPSSVVPTKSQEYRRQFCTYWVSGSALPDVPPFLHTYAYNHSSNDQISSTFSD